MHRIKKILMSLCCIVLVIIIGWMVVSAILVNKVKSIPIATLDLSHISDGSYIGEYSILPVHVKVEVIIENCKISSIQILEHDNGLGSPAENIINVIVKKQTLDVDAVSGATVSSKCILKAVEDAVIMQEILK